MSKLDKATREHGKMGSCEVVVAEPPTGVLRFRADAVRTCHPFGAHADQPRSLSSRLPAKAPKFLVLRAVKIPCLRSPNS
jgi:hypothetical protein